MRCSQGQRGWLGQEGVRAVMKSHGGGSPPLIASEEARGQGCGMGTCKVPASPVSSPSSPPSSLRPRSGLACLQPTVLATPVITTRVAAEEAAVVERVLYAARTEGGKKRANIRAYDLRFCWRGGQWRWKANATSGERMNGRRGSSSRPRPPKFICPPVLGHSVPTPKELCLIKF